MYIYNMKVILKNTKKQNCWMKRLFFKYKTASEFFLRTLFLGQNYDTHTLCVNCCCK